MTEWWRIVADAGWTAPHLTPEQGGRGLPATRRSDRPLRVRRVRRAASARRARAADGGADDPDARHPRADRAARAPDPRRPGRLVPALQRARRRLGSRRASPPAPSATATAGSSTARRCGAARRSSPTTACCSPGPTLDRPEAPRHLVVRLPARPARRHDPAAARDDRRRGVQRGVPRRRRLRRRRTSSAARATAGPSRRRRSSSSAPGIGAGGAHAGFPAPGPKGGMLGRTRRRRGARPDAGRQPHAVARRRPQRWRVSTAGTTIPSIRQKLARLVTLTSARGSGTRCVRRRRPARGGGQSVANIGKLAQTRIVKLSAEIALDILGAVGHARQPRRARRAAGSRTRSCSRRRRRSTAAPTRSSATSSGSARSDCPRDPNPDRDVPYGEVLRRSASNDR